MYQTERIKLFFKDKTESHTSPHLGSPDWQINLEPIEGLRLTVLTELEFRASLASLADYGTPLNIIRIVTCVDQLDLEFRLVLPLQQICNLEHWPAWGSWQPASTSWQISTRVAYSETHCRNNAGLFAIIHYCTNITVSLNPVDPVRSHLSNPIPFF